MTSILITGATGYIGGCLAKKLIGNPEFRIRLLVRRPENLPADLAGQVEIVQGDTFDRKILLHALSGIRVAYYLIHSMGGGKDFEQKDRISAENFRDACIDAGVQRVIYLGGLGELGSASSHLRSRMETGEILSAGPQQLQTIWFRAGVIVGQGSAGFEIIKNLVKKLPVMITPRWVRTRTQPIGIDDALAYLTAAAKLDVTGNLVVDIGVKEVTTFKGMMELTAGLMDYRLMILPFPVLTPHFSSYWLILFSPISFHVAAALIEGLRSETVITNNNAEIYFPGISTISLKEAVRHALGITRE